MHGLPIDCERARLQASLAADREISELERAGLAAHLERCAACAEYVRSVRQLVRVVRETPAIEPTLIRVARRRRPAARVQVVAAAAAVLAALAAGSLAGALTGGGAARAQASQAAAHRLQIQQSLLALASAERRSPPKGHGGRRLNL